MSAAEHFALVVLPVGVEVLGEHGCAKQENRFGPVGTPARAADAEAAADQMTTRSLDYTRGDGQPFPYRIAVPQ